MAHEHPYLEKLQPLLGDAVALLPVDDVKFGDVCVRVRTEQGTSFYAGDFIANIQALPKNLLYMKFPQSQTWHADQWLPQGQMPQSDAQLFHQVHRRHMRPLRVAGRAHPSAPGPLWE